MTLIPRIALTITLAHGLSAMAGDKLDVVYHVSEVERVPFVINNINNHIKGAGRPDKVNIVLVAHGPAVAAFNDIEATDAVRERVTNLQGQGVGFEMCGNTLKVMDVALDELLPGFVEVSQGGVTRIAELQSQGYVYIRP